MNDEATEEGAISRSEITSNRKLGRSLARAGAGSDAVTSGWRQLYGGFHDLGVSIESHDFQLADTFKGSRAVHPESVELCLNLAGQGSIRGQKGEMAFEPLTAGFYLPGQGALQAWRCPGHRHRFVTVEFSADFLRSQLGACDGGLHPLVEDFVHGNSRCGGMGEVHPLTIEQEQSVSHLLRPPVFQAARGLWYQSKVLQLIVEFFFERQGPNELFCDRQKRTSRERAERVVAFLRQRLSEPPSLEEIGREVGCSPFHLSRIFSREMAMTIPQYLRKIRMERAAELLRSGKYNVTEAAMEVGYSSLSHFSQAFCQTMGCCPALYPPAGLRLAESRGSSWSSSEP